MKTLKQNDYVGNYKILNKIGEGGMALIYKALQPALKRSVVLKNLKDPNREIISRFKKEALLSASFHHENLVAIYDFIYSNHSYYLVMEYVDGEDLRTIIDHMAPLPPHIAALIILGIARGLEYTHTRTIVHRDIKPSNILVSFTGGVKLIDFGIAKDDVSTRLTMTGMIVGTPTYMSPEQANGETPSDQSDLFSLGIILYEALTGLKPFYGENNTEVLTKIIRNKFIPPEHINPNIPHALRKIVKKALRKEQSKRYQNATEFIHDLEVFIPWQLRSKKKDVLSQFLRKLDKTTPSSEESLKMAVYSAIPAWSWRLARGVLVILFLFLLGFQTVKFTESRLGYVLLKQMRPSVSFSLDNKEPEETNGRLKLIGPLLAGTHRFTLNDKKNGQTQIYFLNVSASDTAEISLQPARSLKTAQLAFSSQPEDAAILIDGHPIGRTPHSEVELIPGKHRIQIEKRGFQPVDDYIDTNASTAYQVKYILTAHD